MSTKLIKILTMCRTIAYILVTLVLAYKLGLMSPWALYAFWGLLMALWEQPTHHWGRSIFKRWGWSEEFWDATVSWKNKAKILGIGFPWNDSFHISKSLSILLVAAIPLTLVEDWDWKYALAAGWLTTESFNLFYNYILDTGEQTQ
jgi:hypothetical protein